MRQGRNGIGSVPLVALALLTATGAFAQSQGPPPQQQPTQGQDAGQPKPGAPQATPLTLDSAPPPVSAEEDAAIKAFREVPVSEVEKKEQAGEDFVIEGQVPFR